MSNTIQKYSLRNFTTKNMWKTNYARLPIGLGRKYTDRGTRMHKLITDQTKIDRETSLPTEAS